MPQVNLWLIAVILSEMVIPLNQNYSLAKLADFKILITQKTPSYRVALAGSLICVNDITQFKIQSWKFIQNSA
jgi:hypothetical protein